MQNFKKRQKLLRREITKAPWEDSRARERHSMEV